MFANANFLAFLLLLKAWNVFGSDDMFALVIDAGSSQSTMYVYKFEERITSYDEYLKDGAPKSAPDQIEQSERFDPISGLTSQESCDTLISKLTDFGKTVLSDEENRWDEFPIYLKATAGMRILATDRREDILTWIEKSFGKTAINPFNWETTYSIIASGEEEATFDWLAVNSVFGTLDNGDDSKTYGALDLGGQSTQIAFAPDPASNILAGFTAVRLWKTTHRLFTYSLLSYGMDAVEQRIAQSSYDEWLESGGSGTIIIGANEETYLLHSEPVYNPCINVGVSENYTINDDSGGYTKVTQIGNSMNDTNGCKRLMEALLAKDTDCYVKDCAFNGVYLAEIPDNMTFVAFSGFAYTISDLSEVSDKVSSTMDLGTLDEVAQSICSMTYTGLQASEYNTGSDYMKTYCRSLTYIHVLLAYGYGFPETNTPIEFTKKHDGKSLSWTQGSILRDANWLPYTLDFDTDIDTDDSHDGALESTLKAWRVVEISAVVTVALSIW